MKTFTLYLCKSNRSNPNVVIAIRDLIIKSGFKVEEFNGGKYSPDPLMASDGLIMIGTDFTTNIGRGLYDQINLILRDNPVKFLGKMLYVTGENEAPANTYRTKQIIGVATTDTTDWINYGKVELADEELNAAIAIDAIRKKLEEHHKISVDTGDINF